MVFRFLIISDEIDDFKREIQINSNATFLDFHKMIIQSTNWKDDEMSSFFICNDYWEKEKEITLTEMDTSSEEDSYIMEQSILEDFLEDEKQKIMYVFDYLTERALFIELREIITGKNLEKAVCTKSIGDAPSQYVEFEEIDTTKNNSLDVGESFYGDEGYDMDELDSEGFDGLDENVTPSEDEGF